MKRNALQTLALAALVVALSFPAWLLATSPTGVLSNSVFTGDYLFDADPAIKKALEGSVFSMYSTDPPPLMMPLALLLRLPAVGFGLLVGALDWGSATKALDARYLWGALWLAGLSALGVGVAVLRMRLAPITVPLAAAAAVVVVWFANPVFGAAVRWGHVEEVGMAALMALAFLMLADRRLRLAAIAAAAALAVKQPAVLILPVLLLAVPKGQRLRFLGWYVGAAVLLIAPFIVANLGDVLAQTRDVAGSFQGSKFHFNVFDALGLGDSWKSQSRLWTFVAAAAIPCLYARRSNWELALAPAVAIATAVMLLRCVLDPYNIVYYAAPAAALALVWELLAIQKGAHPLSRFRLFQKAPVPVLSLAASGVYSACTHGFMSEMIDSLAGGERSSSILYALLAAAMLIFVLTWAKEPFAWMTRRRLRLYGGLLAGVLAVIGALVVVDRPSRLEASSPAPGGFRSAAPETIKREISPQRAWWLGPEGPGNAPLRLSAYGPSRENREYWTAMFDYGTAEGFDGITINTTKRGQWKESDYRCLDRCGPKFRDIETRFGPGVVGRTFLSSGGSVLPQDEVWIKAGDHMLFIMVTDTERYPLEEVLENLRPLEQDANGSAGE